MAAREPLETGNNGSLATGPGAAAAAAATVFGQILPEVTMTTIATSALVLLLTTLAWRRFLSPLRNVPGPFWASLTRLWHVKIIIDGNQNEQLRDAHERYGPFVRMAPNEVSVSHPDGVKKLLLATLPKASNATRARASWGGGRGLFYGITALPDWRFQTPMSSRDPKVKIERSKAFASGYALSNVLKYEEPISRTVEKLVGWLDRHAASGGPMDLDRFLSFTTFDVVGEVVFSRPFGFIDKGEDIGDSIANNCALEALGTPLSQFKWTQVALGNPLITMLGLTPSTMLLRTALETLAERQKNPDARFDVVAHWFKYLEQHPDRTNFRNIEAQTTTNIGAGSDTVSCALQSVIYHMARHPNTWIKAREEIVKAQDGGLCTDKVIQYADAQQLPYLQACIKEGLRIHSPVPMGLPRIVPKGGVEIDGHYFPAGTTLSINPWVLHRDRKIWGEDADEFRPERWLTEDAASLEKNFIPVPVADVQEKFGAGYNSCPGQHVARMELLKICSTIIRDYNVKLVDPSKKWKWEAYFTMVPHDWPVYVSKT